MSLRLTALVFLMVSILPINQLHAQSLFDSDDVWFKSAMEVANINGERANAMGTQFLQGTKDLKKDVSKAIKLFEIGTKKHNYKHCYYNLSQIYGPETDYTDFAKAVVNAKKCVELFPSSSIEHQESLYNLGYMYQNGGYGLNRNIPNAITWYKKSLALGDSDAALRLAYIYVRGGDGVTANKSLVKSYVEKSAQMGNDEAIQMQKYMRINGIDELIGFIKENGFH